MTGFDIAGFLAHMKTRCAGGEGESLGEGTEKRGWKIWVLLVGLVPVVLTSCGAPGGYGPPVPVMSEMPWNGPEAARKAAGSAQYAPAPEERPGLGTGWGKEVESEMSYTSFERSSSKPYSGVAVIHYNDRQGVEAMTGWKSSRSSMQSAAGGLVEWGVKASSGSLKNYYSGGRRFVVGKEGQRYVLVVKNKSRSRLEMVLSVDGLDVMDGKAASTRKRGYIVEPGKTLEVKGWRKSRSAVASFKFSGVGNSYANQKHGDTRNVGVIGLAVFTQKGVDPFTWMPHEVRKRGAASPFAEAP